MLQSFSLSLRPFLQSDSKSLAYHANNKQVWKNLRDQFPYPYAEKDAVDFIEKIAIKHPTSIFAIDVNGEAIGAAGIILKDDVNRLNGEIGYWLGQDYWGKGIATKVVSELTRVAFNDLNLFRVYAEVFGTNSASAKVLEKNGFIKEATLTKAIIKDGEILDLFIFSKINEKK